jgi:hypothetical protein
VTPGAPERLPSPHEDPQCGGIHELRLGQVHDDVALPIGDHVGEGVPDDVDRGQIGFAPQGDDRDGTVGEHRDGQPRARAGWR